MKPRFISVLFKDDLESGFIRDQCGNERECVFDEIRSSIVGDIVAPLLHGLEAPLLRYPKAFYTQQTKTKRLTPVDISQSILTPKQEQDARVYRL